jgi:hypothetical protein
MRYTSLVRNWDKNEFVLVVWAPPCELLVEKHLLTQDLETMYDRNYGFRRPCRKIIELALLETKKTIFSLQTLNICKLTVGAKMFIHMEEKKNVFELGAGISHQ